MVGANVIIENTRLKQFKIVQFVSKNQKEVTY